MFADAKFSCPLGTTDSAYAKVVFADAAGVTNAMAKSGQQLCGVPLTISVMDPEQQGTTPGSPSDNAAPPLGNGLAPPPPAQGGGLAPPPGQGGLAPPGQMTAAQLADFVPIKPKSDRELRLEKTVKLLGIPEVGTLPKGGRNCSGQLLFGGIISETNLVCCGRGISECSGGSFC